MVSLLFNLIVSRCLSRRFLKINEIDGLLFLKSEKNNNPYMKFLFFEIALIGYLASTVTGIAELFKSSWFTRKTVFFAAVLGFVSHSIHIALQYIQAGHIPIVSFHQAVSFLTWSIVFVFFVLQYRYRSELLGSFVMPVAFVLMFSASTLPRQIQPLLNPMLKSYWFGIHIFFAFIGDAAFALAFTIGFMYLIQERYVKSKRLGGLFKRLPNLQLLDEINYRLISVGFPFLSLAIISGIIWAETATGLYWRWDPKEVWSLITWIIYALVLHLRLSTGWRGKKAAILSIVGFMVVLLAFFITHLLRKGFHVF